MAHKKRDIKILKYFIFIFILIFNENKFFFLTSVFLNYKNFDGNANFPPRGLKCKFPKKRLPSIVDVSIADGHKNERPQFGQVSGASCPTFSVGHGSPRLYFYFNYKKIIL